MLKVAEGKFVSVTGDVSLICYRCHSTKYRQWKAGTHGKGPSCAASGCHDPHNPVWIGIRPVIPFLGNSIEVKAVGERESFTALPGPPGRPEIPDFLSMKILTVLGLIGIVSAFVLAERKRRIHAES
ncbi:MAG: hypothetical protein C4521_10975 [Actinobacteria bacterium]|jgi:hypothetical protein|nr:MAG: hypothetical protein C4521_10975 [Actinomycetota bacterium]